jgi:hypothetical protein
MPHHPIGTRLRWTGEPTAELTPQRTYEVIRHMRHGLNALKDVQTDRELMGIFVCDVTGPLWELVEAVPAPPERYILFNATIGMSGSRVFDSYEDILTFMVNSEHPNEYHIIPLRSVTKVNPDKTVEDYR